MPYAHPASAPTGTIHGWQVAQAVLSELPRRLQGANLSTRISNTLFGGTANLTIRVSDWLCGTHMQIERAPEPADVLWENLQYHPRQQLVRGLLSTTIMLVVVVVGTLLLNVATLYTLPGFRFPTRAGVVFYDLVLYVISVAILTTGSLLVLVVVPRVANSIERPHTKTARERSVTLKLAFFMVRLGWITRNRGSRAHSVCPHRSSPRSASHRVAFTLDARAAPCRTGATSLARARGRDARRGVRSLTGRCALIDARARWPLSARPRVLVPQALNPLLSAALFLLPYFATHLNPHPNYRFSPGWYVTGGQVVLMTILGDLSLINFGFALFRPADLRRRKAAHRARTQSMMNALYASSGEGYLAFRLCLMARCVIVGTAFSFALPVFHLIIGVYCFTSHWVDRYIYLRRIALPSAGNASPDGRASLMNLVLNYILPLAILLHLVLAIRFLPDVCSRATQPLGDALFAQAIADINNPYDAPLAPPPMRPPPSTPPPPP